MTAEPVGPGRLGGLAADQIDAARTDPRTTRGPEAPIADFEDALEEAGRARSLSVGATHALQDALEREEQRLGVRRDDPALSDDDARALQAAWERAQLARAEVANDFPYLNAVTVQSMHAALDALVEGLAPEVRKLPIHFAVARLLDRVRALDALVEKLAAEGGKAPMRVEAAELLDRIRRERPELADAAAAVHPDAQRAAHEAVVQVVLEDSGLPRLPRLRGCGVARYEPLLAEVGLQAPPDRPVPAELDRALVELSALRNVLAHRAGRVDELALRDCPWLGEVIGPLGTFVRLSRAQYRRYSTAVSAYGAEIRRRLMGVNAGRDFDLDDWEDFYRLGP